MSEPDDETLPPHREVELKLRLDPAQAGRFARHDRLKALATGRPGRRRLVSTYFDTPDHRLRKQGLELRVRGDGDGWTQTVKRQPDGDAGGLGRDEFEAALTAPHPDPEQVDDAAVRRVLASRKIRKGLRPVFTVAVDRRTWPVRLNATAMEVALDVGEIVADGVTLPVCEAEIELKSGSVHDLYRLARELNRSVPLGREARSKAERGYALAAGGGRGAVKAAPLTLDPGATVAEAMATIGRSCLQQLHGNAVLMQEGGGAPPEVVHQLRVAIRRMRSALSIFRDAVSTPARKRLAADLKWIAQRCGPAREWDVFAADIVAPLRERLPEDPGLAWLAEAVAAERAAAQQAVLAMVTDHAFTDRLLEIEAWWQAIGEPRSATGPLARPARAHAAAVLARLDAKLYKRGKHLDGMVEADLHELRICGKKLRYATEFFRSYSDGDGYEAYARTLVRLQDRLGTLNDAAVARRQMDRLAETAAAQDPRLLARVSGLVAGWNAARLDADLRKLPGVWEKFAEAPRSWA